LLGENIVYEVVLRDPPITEVDFEYSNQTMLMEERRKYKCPENPRATND
jgi:hypothetical protein